MSWNIPCAIRRPFSSVLFELMATGMRFPFESDHGQVVVVRHGFVEIMLLFEHVLIAVQFPFGVEVRLVHSFDFLDGTVEEFGRRSIRLQNHARFDVGEKDGIGRGLDQRSILLGSPFRVRSAGASSRKYRGGSR